jgi:hypothetical protein
LIFETAADGATTPEETSTRLKNTLKALQSGIEKCTSTMGIHESRGYGRLFASIGLSSGIAAALGTNNYAGSEQGGLTWEDLDADLDSRRIAYHSAGRGELSRVNHFYPKIWKAAGKLGKGEADGNHVTQTSLPHCFYVFRLAGRDRLSCLRRSCIPVEYAFGQRRRR